jgi:hypothetical protein
MPPTPGIKAAGLDAKAQALARLAAPIAAGATVDEIVGILIAVASITGLAPVVTAARAVAARSATTIDWASEALDSDLCD